MKKKGLSAPFAPMKIRHRAHQVFERIIIGGEPAIRIFCNLYNAQVRSEYLPDQWQTSVIIRRRSNYYVP